MLVIFYWIFLIKKFQKKMTNVFSVLLEIIGMFLECFGIFRFIGICPTESGNITIALINHMVSPVSSVVYVQV